MARLTLLTVLSALFIASYAARDTTTMQPDILVPVTAPINVQGINGDASDIGNLHALGDVLRPPSVKRQTPLPTLPVEHDQLIASLTPLKAHPLSKRQVQATRLLSIPDDGTADEGDEDAAQGPMDIAGEGKDFISAMKRRQTPSMNLPAVDSGNSEGLVPALSELLGTDTSKDITDGFVKRQQTPSPPVGAQPNPSPAPASPPAPLPATSAEQVEAGQIEMGRNVVNSVLASPRLPSNKRQLPPAPVAPLALPLDQVVDATTVNGLARAPYRPAYGHGIPLLGLKMPVKRQLPTVGALGGVGKMVNEALEDTKGGKAKRQIMAGDMDDGSYSTLFDRLDEDDDESTMMEEDDDIFGKRQLSSSSGRPLPIVDSAVPLLGAMGLTLPMKKRGILAACPPENVRCCLAVETHAEANSRYGLHLVDLQDVVGHVGIQCNLLPRTKTCEKQPACCNDIDQYQTGLLIGCSPILL